jgi:hypothetical protein
LSSRPVKRGHQLGMETLPERLIGYRGLEVGEDLEVTAHNKTGFDQCFEYGQALILQPSCRQGNEGRISDVGESRAPPKRERRRKQAFGARGVAFRERSSALGCEFCEPKSIYLRRVQVQHISRPVPHDHDGLAR